MAPSSASGTSVADHGVTAMAAMEECHGFEPLNFRSKICPVFPASSILLSPLSGVLVAELRTLINSRSPGVPGCKLAS